MPNEEPPFTHKSSILIADMPDETDLSKIVPIQLKSGTMQNELNLVDHPENWRKKIYIVGYVCNYLKQKSLKSIASYSWTDD